MKSMKSLKWHLFVIGCILVCLSPHARAATACAPFGQTGTGTISSPGQSNACTFSANANDVVDFTVVTTSGSLSPEICLYNSAGTQLVCAANRFPDGVCAGGSVIELDTFTLPATETYTVIISDCSHTNTGNYIYYSQRTNNPSRAANLPFAEVGSATIGSAALDNTYTFSAKANDVIDFTMVATGGNLSPRIRLYGPAGNLLADAANRFPDGVCAGGSVLELDTVKLSTSGTYTVLVGDCSDTKTGNYDIYAQRTNNPSGAANLPFAQVESATIGSAALDNTYTFSAKANDVIDFTMVAIGGNLSPRIRLYGPAGNLLADAANRFPDGVCAGGSVIELDTVTLKQSGTYTVLVGDCSDTNTGNYDIYAQRTEHPSGPGSLPFGQTTDGTIGSAARDNTYTFSANANDVVDFTMVATSGNLSPRIRLYGPAGNLLADAANRFPDGVCAGGSVIELDTVTLKQSGTYTVLVGDCSDTNTGNYDIFAQRTNNPSGAQVLLFAQTQTGNIASVAQDNSYIFSGSANDIIDFTMVGTSGNLSPRIRLYSPAGNLLADAANRFPDGVCAGGSVLELDTVKLPTSGTYTVLVGDCGDKNTGNYTIYAQRTNNPFGPASFVWGGQAGSGNIGSVAQNNTYNFGGSASNVVDFTMTATSGSLSPRIRLYNPDGSLVIDAANRFPDGVCAGGSTLEVNSVTLTQNGIYTVLVGDCSDTNTGNYNISGQCFGTCPVMPAITWPTPAAITYPTPLGATQLDAKANVAGTLVYSPVSGTVLAAGPHNLSVTFTPSDTTTYSTARDSVQLTVNKATTTTTLSSSLNPSTYGQAVTFTAKVSPEHGGMPTGSVTFKSGTTSLATVSLVNSTATFTTAKLSAGTKSITAVYNGDLNYLTSTSAAVTQVIDKAATKTTLSSSLNPSKFGQSVTFTATVSSGGGTPTGTVTFKDGTTILGTGTLSSGKAEISTSKLSVGSHSITGAYGGSVNFEGSTSPVLTQIVNP